MFTSYYYVRSPFELSLLCFRILFTTSMGLMNAALTFVFVENWLKLRRSDVVVLRSVIGINA